MVTAQLGDLDGPLLVLLFVLYLAMPAIGLGWPIRLAWRRKVSLRQLILLVTYWAVWFGMLFNQATLARIVSAWSS
jgi:hypothetical protein